MMARSDGPRTVARNAAAAYGERALLMVSALLLTPYLFRRLGLDGFGTWSLMFTVATIFTVLELGISVGVTKYVADFRAVRLPHELHALVGSAVAAMALIGGGTLVISVTLGFFATGLVPDSQREAFTIGMVAIGLGMLIRFPCVAYVATLKGYQRYDRSSAAMAAATVLFAAGAVVAVETGHAVVGVAIAYSVSLAVGGLICAAMLHRIERDLPLTPRFRGLGKQSALFRFGSFALLADSMVFVGQRMDVVVVAALRGAAAAAPLAAASKLQSGLQALTLPFIVLLLPMTADLWSRKEERIVAQRLTLATRLTVQLTLPIAGWLALFSGDIVKFWLGPTAPPVTAAIVSVLAVQTLFIAATPAEKVLVGIGRVRTIGWLNTAEGLTNICISIVLVATMGVVGAALGSLIASALLGPAKLPVACRALGRPLRRFLQDAIGVPVASSAPALLAMLGLLVALEPGIARSIAGLIAAIMLSGAVAFRQIGAERARSILAQVRQRARP